MAGTAFDNVKLVGLTGAVPRNVVTSRSFGDVFGKDTVERFINLTGVEQLHKAERKQTAGDLGYVAARRLIEKSNVNPSDIGALIFITESPDYIWPSTSYVIHHRLKLSSNCIVFDVNLGCSGFVYGIHICASLLQSMTSRYAMLITGQADKFQDFTKREKPDDSNAMMFGDGATALLLERDDSGACSLRTELFGDGSGYRLMIRGGMCRSIDENKQPERWNDGLDRSIEDPYMDGMGVFAFSTRQAPKAISDFLNKYALKLEDFDKVFFHQANKMIVERIAKKLGISLEKVPMTLKEYGNTSSATIPITMIDCYKNDRSDDLKQILMCGFGVGTSWGVVSAYISTNNIYPIVETDDYFAEGELFKNCF